MILRSRTPVSHQRQLLALICQPVYQQLRFNHHALIKYRILGRPFHQSTFKNTEPTSQYTAQDPELKHPTANKPRRSLRPYIWATFFLLSGLAGGQFIRYTILPPPLPEPNTQEDVLLLKKSRDCVDKLPIVQELRSLPHEWEEREAYGDLTNEEKNTHFSAGSSAGIRGLGVQRIFYNARERRSVSVLSFGGATSGWPGVTHGGAIAAVLQENMERVANGGQDLGDVILDDINIQYRRPTHIVRLFLIRAEMDEPGSPEGTGRKMHVKATLEDLLSGTITVQATATAAPRN
jgi:hypothetical protein